MFCQLEVSVPKNEHFSTNRIQNTKLYISLYFNNALVKVNLSYFLYLPNKTK
jgi:hypothetical protein